MNMKDSKLAETTPSDVSKRSARNRIAGLLCASLLMLGTETARAAIVIDFEGLGDLTAVTNQFAGVQFSGATVLTAGVSLNEFDFPPRFGSNVVFDESGPITITFAVPVLAFHAYFTYTAPLSIVAYDAGNSPVSTDLSNFSSNLACLGGVPPCLADAGSSPNELLSVAFAGGISSLSITGAPLGGSFVMDDVTAVTPTAVIPEPGLSPVVAACIGLIAVGRLALRSRGDSRS
jgi:hypothetical protein